MAGTVCDPPVGLDANYYTQSAVWQNAKLWEPGSKISVYLPDHRDSDSFREAVKAWGPNLVIEYLTAPDKAEVRINFDQSGSSWSYVGNDALLVADGPTMNFGWSLADDFDTALHEVGHFLSLGHEHQNPRRTIRILRSAAHRYYATTQGWSPQITDQQVVATQPGSFKPWDANSIMHYPLPAQIIYSPTPYSREGVNPEPGLSALDIEWVRETYPLDETTVDCPGPGFYRIESDGEFTAVEDISSVSKSCGDTFIWKSGSGCDIHGKVE